MKIEGKINSVTLHEHGGMAQITSGASAPMGPAATPPGAMGASVNVNFTPEHAMEFSSLVGKTVSVEISEVV